GHIFRRDTDFAVRRNEGPTMMRRLLVLIALGVPGAAAAQAPATPYTRYAAVITARADSVVGYLTTQVGTLTDDAAVGTLATGATRMQRLTSEFAAYAPPSDLASVHHDLVAALTLATSKADHAASLMRTAMNTSNSDEQRTTAAETAQRELTDLQTAIASYQEARARAARALAQNGATLP
ncbi:MAG: hypothetical protein ACHQX4_11420, partial [Gemmatimonadales bacterium]